MISLIICSRNPVLHSELTDNIISTIGLEFEIISIDNSKGNYSIFSAYNEGYRRSKYPYLCFIHEDIRFHTPGWGTKLVHHLSSPQVGVIGVAGNDLVHRVPSAWSYGPGQGKNLLQRQQDGNVPPIHMKYPENYTGVSKKTVTLDGMLLALRKELMDNGLLFDEEMTGFHGYDYDISIRSALAGYQNLIVYDILIEHFSRGKTNQAYFDNLIYIYRKYASQLPVATYPLTAEELVSINALERKSLDVLLRKMVRKGFGLFKIKSEMNYFSNLIQYNSYAGFIGFKISVLRLVHRPQYLFKR